MKVRDCFLAAFVAVLWGLNFVAVYIGLSDFPPFFFAGFRYLILAVPVMLLVPRPDVPLRWLLGAGLGAGAVQFGFLFLAIDIGMPPGLSSLVLQACVPFTVALGALLLHERVSPRQLAGVTIAGLGIIVIAWDRSLTAALLPVLLTLVAALGAAFGTLATRQAKTESPLRFAMWMSVVPPLPMLALSAALEGPTAGWRALQNSFTVDGWAGLLALVYIVVLGTVVGTAIWIALLSRYPAGLVAPFSMLVPVVGIAAAAVILHERPSLLALAGGVAVIAGLALGAPTSNHRSPSPDSADDHNGQNTGEIRAPSPQSERHVV